MDGMATIGEMDRLLTKCLAVMDEAPTRTLPDQLDRFVKALNKWKGRPDNLHRRKTATLLMVMRDRETLKASFPGACR